MKPNEARCEENQGVRGEKIPPPITEFENPGRPLDSQDSLFGNLTPKEYSLKNNEPEELENDALYLTQESD